MNIQYAALINVGDNPLVGLLVLLIVVGIVVWVALWLLDNFAKQIMNDLFYKAARMLIIFIAVVIVLDKALEVIFGISLF